MEVIAIFGESILIGGTGGAKASAIEASLFSSAGVAIGASVVGIMTVSVATMAG